MFPRSIRLNKKKSFDEIRTKGKLFQGKYLGVSYRDRGDKEISKIGSIISTKISKKAVERNRIKRAINETLQKLYRELPGGYDFVIMAKRNIVDIPNKEIKYDITKTFEGLKENFPKNEKNSDNTN